MHARRPLKKCVLFLLSEFGPSPRARTGAQVRDRIMGQESPEFTDADLAAVSRVFTAINASKGTLMSTLAKRDEFVSVLQYLRTSKKNKEACTEKRISKARVAERTITAQKQPAYAATANDRGRNRLRGELAPQSPWVPMETEEQEEEQEEEDEEEVKAPAAAAHLPRSHICRTSGCRKRCQPPQPQTPSAQKGRASRPESCFLNVSIFTQSACNGSI